MRNYRQIANQRNLISWGGGKSQINLNNLLSSDINFDGFDLPLTKRFLNGVINHTIIGSGMQVRKDIYYVIDKNFNNNNITTHLTLSSQVNAEK